MPYVNQPVIQQVVQQQVQQRPQGQMPVQQQVQQQVHENVPQSQDNKAMGLKKHRTLNLLGILKVQQVYQKPDFTLKLVVSVKVI